MRLIALDDHRVVQGSPLGRLLLGLLLGGQASLAD